MTSGPPLRLCTVFVSIVYVYNRNTLKLHQSATASAPPTFQLELPFPHKKKIPCSRAAKLRSLGLDVRHVDAHTIQRLLMAQPHAECSAPTVACRARLTWLAVLVLRKRCIG